MVDRRSQSGLAKLGRPHLLQRQRAALQQLHDYRALQQRVIRKVHDSTAACTNLADELVVLDDASGHSLIISSERHEKMNLLMKLR
jgi:hypothetical protein